jgi:tripartite-type tricarboxylate transporter receptor subunit TctC
MVYMEIESMKIRYGLLLLVLAAMLPVAQGQTTKWPNKPVRTIVPMVPGGNSDIIARLIAARLSEQFGQQFVVDNRAGAGGSIGAAMVTRATPDGYTLIIMSSSYAANAALYKPPYDPIKDITPIGIINMVPFIVAVNPSVKAANFKEFIDLVRARPRTLNFGSPGTGSTPHLAGTLLQQMARIEMVHIPYKGDGPALTDLIAGQIQLQFATGVVFMPHITSGKIRALAVTTEQRSPANPDLPAISEVVPGYAVSGWTGMWGPAGLPKEIVSRIDQALGRVVKLPEVQERLRIGGAIPAHTSPDEFARFIERDITKWTNVVKTANIKVE